MPPSEFWIVAGPNGAGKTTLVQTKPIQDLLPHARFLNPDDIAMEHLRRAGFHTFSDAAEADLTEAFLAAANEVQAALGAALKANAPVGVETVLSSGKYMPLVEDTLDRKGFVGLIYVWLDSPELACARVERRAAHGGHHVAQEKIVARWHRSLENLAWFLPRVSRFWIYDNSDCDPEVAPRLLAVGGHGRTEFWASAVPERIASVLPPFAC